MSTRDVSYTTTLAPGASALVAVSLAELGLPLVATLDTHHLRGLHLAVLIDPPNQDPVTGAIEVKSERAVCVEEGWVLFRFIVSH
jgi:hypothetical protein